MCRRYQVDKAYHQPTWVRLFPNLTPRRENANLWYE